MSLKFSPASLVTCWQKLHFTECVSGSPAPSVTWWKDGGVFDDTYELVKKHDNGGSNSTVIVDGDDDGYNDNGYDGNGYDGNGYDGDDDYDDDEGVTVVQHKQCSVLCKK